MLSLAWAHLIDWKVYVPTINHMMPSKLIHTSLDQNRLRDVIKFVLELPILAYNYWV